MKGRYLNMKKSVLLSWVVSYVLILFIPLLLSSIVYIESENIIKKQITDSNASMLKQLQSEVDGHLQEVESLSLKISGNSKLIKLMNIKDENKIISNFSNVEDVLSMNEDFNVYTLSNRFIKSFYIFFNNKDLVWSNSSLDDKRSFYNNTISNSNISYEKWLSIMNKKGYNSYIPFYVKNIHSSSANSEGIKTIAYTVNLSTGMENASAKLVILMDEEKLNRDIQTIANTNNSSVYILDENNNILFDSSNNSDFLSVEDYKNMNDDLGLFNSKSNGKSVIVSYISSHATSWKYVCVIPDSVFKEKILYINNLTMICYAVCLLLGGIAILILARKNYNPVKELVITLKNIYGVNKQEKDNEFLFIKDSLNNMYYEKQSISEKLKLQNDTIRLNFISKLLTGKFHGGYPDKDILSSYDISFKSDNFAVILFYIDNSSVQTLENIYKNEEDYVKSLQVLLLNRLKSTLKDGYEVYISMPDDMIAGIVNISDEKIGSWKEEVLSSISELQQELMNNLNVSVTVSLSGINKNLSGVNQAYQQAMNAMEYKLFNGYNEVVINYDEVKHLAEKNYNYYYSIEDELKLINSIKLGELEKAEKIINEVLDNNLSSKKISVHMAKCIMLDIISTFIKVFNNEGLLNNSRILEDKDIVARIFKCKTLEDMKSELLELLKVACPYINEHNQKNNKLVQKVNSFILTNFADENLNVSTLADALGMNAKYISSFYKEATGNSIVDLINHVRIEKAKVLLKEEQMNIADTALKVGFTNSNALIRAFKKYIGITPGQFKDMVQ